MQHKTKIKIKLKHENTHATNQLAKDYHANKYSMQQIIQDKISNYNRYLRKHYKTTGNFSQHLNS